MYKGSTNQEAGESMENPGRKLKKILFILGITGTVYLGFRYLLPLVVPFLCAYGMALWLRPSVRYLERKISARRSVGVWIGAIELLVLFVGFGVLLYWGGRRLFAQMERFTAMLPRWLVWLDEKLTGLCRMLEQTLGLKEEYLVGGAREMIREISSAVRQATMPAIMNNSVAIVAGLAEVIIFLVIFVIATLMFLQEMEEIRERKSQSMFHREFAIIGRRVAGAVGAWIKTESVILGINSILFTLGLLLIGNEYALLLGIGIGMLDALPFVGAGIILVPWGIVFCIQKQLFAGGVLLGIFGVAYVLRQMLEARIMGDKVGLSPIETLVSMYVGIQLFGLAGFLLGPLGLLVIEDMVAFYWNEELH